MATSLQPRPNGPANPKDKTLAIILAICTGFFTYLYTYQRDSSKFIGHLVGTVLSCGLWGVIAWIIAIVDSVGRDDQFYLKFPNGDLPAITGNDFLVYAYGVNGQVALRDDRITISRKGSPALWTQGIKGDKDIYIRQISSVQFKEPGNLNGFIQFAFMGGIESKAGILDAATDENTFFFTLAQAPNFRELRDKLNVRIQAINAPVQHVAPAASSLDDLEKLASLRDRGIITNDEFEQKKKQLLGL